MVWSAANSLDDGGGSRDGESSRHFETDPGKRKPDGNLNQDLGTLSGTSWHLKMRGGEITEATHCPGIHRCLTDRRVEACLSLVIIANMFLVVYETDALAEEGGTVPDWAVVCNFVILFIYATELALQLAVHRCNSFKDPWMVMDFAVIGPAIFLEGIGLAFVGDLPSTSFFRCLRLLRLARTLHILSWFPELFALMKGLILALKALFWGTALIMIFLMLWSVLAVQFIHPLSRELQKKGVWDDIDCDRCPEAFSSVAMSMLTFIQHILAGDSWGMVSIPIVEAYPVTIFFFLGVLVTVGMAVTNLILAVIVDKAADAKQVSLRIAANSKARKFDMAGPLLRQICVDLDVDKSGTLTFEELIAGYECDGDFKDICDHMDIVRDDLRTVFSMLDSDSSGDVDYDEFVTQLYKMKNDDKRMLLGFIKCLVGDILQKTNAQMGILKGDVQFKLDYISNALSLVMPQANLGLIRTHPMLDHQTLLDPALMQAQAKSEERELAPHGIAKAAPTHKQQDEVAGGREQANQIVQSPKTMSAEHMAELEKPIMRLHDIHMELMVAISTIFPLPQCKVEEPSCLERHKHAEQTQSDPIHLRILASPFDAQGHQVHQPPSCGV